MEDNLYHLYRLFNQVFPVDLRGGAFVALLTRSELTNNETYVPGG